MLTDTKRPHIRAEGSVPQMMWTSVLSLLPPLLVSLIFSGAPAFRILVVAVSSAVLTEMGVRKLFRKRATLYDGSGVGTALLFALLLPSTLPSWEVALGSAFALIFGKEIFGGLGQNPFNPVLVGCAFLFAAFPASMIPFSNLFQGANPVVLAGAFLASGTILLGARLIHWEIPLLYLGSVSVFSVARGATVQEVFFSGTLLLAAFFLVTDPVTTPLTRSGERWFALGSGFLTGAIHQGTSLGGGVTYGILLMNALTPWFDHWFRPRSRQAFFRRR